MIRFIEDKFGLLITAAFVLGIIFPYLGKDLNSLVLPSLAIVLFLTYLKLDYLDIISHIKQPRFLLYVTVMYLLIIPASVYVIFQFFNRDVAIAFLLLSAMPSGTTSAFMTDLLKGNVSLSVAVGLISYLVAPFSLLLLFNLLQQPNLHLDVLGMSRTLLVVSFIPLILSQLVRKFYKAKVTMTEKYYSAVNIIILAIMVYIITAVQSKEIVAQPFTSLIVDAVLLYILFVFLFLAGYFIAFWRNKKDKIALGASKAYMNNALAIGIAFSFFGPGVTILIVLSELTWNTVFLPFQYFVRKMK